jgi:hypothetical protein
VAPVGCWRINNLATIPGTPVATVHTVQSPETARYLLYLQGEQALIVNGEILNAGWDVHHAANHAQCWLGLPGSASALRTVIPSWVLSVQ